MMEDKRNKTPKLANWFMSKFVNEALLEEFFGDLQEIYEDRISDKGKFKAKLMYWVDVLHLILGFTSLKVIKYHTPTIMYKHYLTITSRNLLRNKFYSFISILGLAIGMGVALLIFQYVHFELNYDQFHDNASNTYRILFDRTHSEDSRPNLYHPQSLGVSAKAEIPEITEFVRLYTPGTGTDAIITNPDNNKPFSEDGADLYFVDEAFLQVFSFPLKQGEKTSALENIYSIVITENAAHKYFGDENPIGKTLQIDGGASSGNYTVSGVLKQPPINSHLQFEFLLPMKNFLKLGYLGAVRRNEHIPWFATYVSIDESANQELVREKLDQLIAKNKDKWKPDENVVEKTRLQPVTDIYLQTDSYAYSDYVINRGDIQHVRLFSIIGLFLLIIAWVNYINLSTARANHRSKEVGIRKSIGALRGQLVGQFLMESFLVNLIAAILALNIALLALPILSHMLGIELRFSLLQVPVFWICFGSIIILGSILSGLYPAFVLSGFKPISMLSSNASRKSGSFNLRSGLITFQFLTSLLLISGTYLVYKQIMFMKNQELGIDMEKILVMKSPKVYSEGPKVTDARDISQLSAINAYRKTTFQTFKTKVMGHPSVLDATSSRVVPSQVNNTSVLIQKLGDLPDASQYAKSFYVSNDFPETYGLEFTAGGSFTEEMSNGEPTVIINEEAVRAYGLGTPESAVHERLIDIDDLDTARIVGVVKDFHWQSLREPQTPYLLWYSGGINPYISVKMNLSDIPATLAYLESTYKSFYPGNPFEYFFLDEAFNQQYQSDLQFGSLFFAFTLLAILITCIGLFALVSYSATSRIKEIGIRKVLGASISNLMLLLSREYVGLFLIANILAIPFALYWGQSWLENYAFRISLSIEYFLIPGIILLLISLATVSFKAYSAAQANPVESLKTE